MGRETVDILSAHRARFLSFVTSRVHDRAAAEDILQSAFTRALDRPESVQEARAVPWFYRVLRNAVTDHYRRRAAEARGRERVGAEPLDVFAPHRPPAPCGCVRRALGTLSPGYREILSAVVIDGQAATDFARARGISSGNAAVRMHRARRLLASALRDICGTCTLDGCADCDCRRNAMAGRAV